MASESSVSQEAFRFECGPDWALFRRTLEQRGYVGEVVAKVLDPVDPTRPLETGLDQAVAIRQTAERSPLNTLFRLFLLARWVPEDDVREALTPIEVQSLVDFGLLERRGDLVRSLLALAPYLGMMLVWDFWARLRPDAVGFERVPGVGSATLVAANIAVRRKVGSALDLGTGTGFLALVAAEQAGRVVATDVNDRALSVARLNARLNGITSVEFRKGSLYEPLADDRFDLIMANPPFVISPGREFCYRDSGLGGDRISEEVIRGASARLTEGGFCSVLFNWHHGGETDWSERPGQWVQGSGCDAWLVVFEHHTPLRYAASWLRDAGVIDFDRASATLDEWLDYYRRLEIGRISYGAIVLRRRGGGKNWFRCERVPGGRAIGSASDQIQRVFAAEDLVRSLPDDRALLDLPLRLTPDHELEQFLRPESGRFSVAQTELRQTRGFTFAGEVDRLVATVLAECDGSRPVREAVARLAEALHADPEQVADSAARALKKLLLAGFLSN